MCPNSFHDKGGCYSNPDEFRIPSFDGNLDASFDGNLDVKSILC